MAFTKKTVRDVEVDGKRVLCRVDFNVPLKDGVVGDTTRIVAALPTIKYLVEHNARVILMSHLGRPKGDGPQPELSLAPVAAKLAELSGFDVAFVDDTYGQKAADAVAALEPGKILVLENVRFDKREKKNDPEIAKTLASYGDIFVPRRVWRGSPRPGFRRGPGCLHPGSRWLPAGEGGLHAGRPVLRAQASLCRHPRWLQGFRQDWRDRSSARLR